MLGLHALADQRHAPADQRQASSVKWHIVAIAKAILGLQVLCFASFAFAVQLSTFDFTKLIALLAAAGLPDVPVWVWALLTGSTSGPQTI